MKIEEFHFEINNAIPEVLPNKPLYDLEVNHTPKRKDILSEDEKKLSLKNALRYFPKSQHKELASEFIEERKTYGRIYMYRFRPSYKMYARDVDAYPGKSLQAMSIMLMIQNNLDPAVAQHPHELITYGGNGAVFQNWIQYRLTMRYSSEMTAEQTHVMYSEYPLGLFPSHSNAPRVIVTIGAYVPTIGQYKSTQKELKSPYIS